MLKITQRYLFINFIPPFLVSLFFWISFLIIFQLFRIIGVVINKGVDIGIFFSIVGNIALSFFPIAVPLSVFLAAFYTLNKFSEDSEIIAMRSFGMTKFQLFKPYLIAGVVVSLAMLGLVQEIIPNANRQYRNSIIFLTSKGMMNEIKKGEFFTDIPKVLLFAEDVTDKGNHLHRVFIQTKADEGEERLIYAKEGFLRKILPKEKLGFPEVRLELVSGNIFQTSKEDAHTIYFDRYDYPVISGGIKYNTIYRNSMMSSSELWKNMSDRGWMDEEIKEVAKSGGDVEREKKNLLRKLYGIEIEFWTRLSTPLQTFVFLFLAFCLGIKKGRGDKGRAGTVAFLLIVLYYVLYFGLLGLAQRGRIPSLLVPFVPFTTLILIGQYYYRRLNWNS